jgi:hypothetical protein
MSPLPRLRAAKRRWALLALPALLLRALIPVGFMPVATADGLSIEFCPDAGPLPAAASAAADPHAHHHHHTEGGADPSSASHHAPCPFAASATLAAAPEAASVPAAHALERASGDAEVSARAFVPSIVRAQSPRAPPVPGR